MTPNLRPMSLGEILDRTFQIYRAKFLLLVGIAVFPAVMMLAIYLADMAWLDVHSLLKPFRQSGVIVWNTVVWLGFYHIGSLVGLPFTAAYVKQSSNAVLGRDCSLASALRVLRIRWRSYLWIAVLKVTAVLIIPELLAAGLFIGMGVSMEAAGLLSGSKNWPIVLILIVPAAAGVYLFLRLGSCFSLALPSAVLEGLKGVKALRRSWMLSRNSRGRLISAWVLMALFGWILAYGLQYLLRWGFIYLYWRAHLRMSQHAYQSVFFVENTILGALLGPLFPVAVTLFYYDQRIRHEGFDIEWMMNAAGMNAHVTAGPADLPVAAAAPIASAEPEERPA